jgi:RNA polymerase sigma-B factor
MGPMAHVDTAPRSAPAAGRRRPPRGAGAPEHMLDERALLERYHGDGDLRAREELARRMLPLARGLARRYANGRVPLEDLEQVAALALLKAIDRFDAERRTDLAGYATPTILGELKRHFRDHTWAAHVSRSTQELTSHVKAAVDELRARDGRSPTIREVAGAVGIEPERALEAIEADTARDALPLDAPAGRAAEPASPPPTLADTIGGDDPAYELVENRSALRHGIAALPGRELSVVRMRFAEDLTQAQIAERIGVSQMQVSRLLRRALDRMRAAA